jgi:Putative adhesin
MPTFETPEPISATVEIGVGDVRVVASDRTDTVVEVRPSDPSKPVDVTAAAETRVEYAGGALLVKTPSRWMQYSFRGDNGSVDVHIDVPSGSHVDGKVGVAAIRCSGRLGKCRLKAGVGDLQVEQADTVELTTGAGEIGLGSAAGRADVTAGSGTVRIGTVGGAAVVKNSSGDAWIGDVGGDLRVVTANGTIAVDRAASTVVAKTANGDVRLSEVTRGAIVAQTAMGQIDIGVLDGVAAWLDLNTHFGNVRNQLEATERPAAGQASVEVRGRTSFGDITVHRASPKVGATAEA